MPDPSDPNAEPTFDREGFLSIAEKRRSSTVAQRMMAQAQMMQQAAVDVEKLTGYEPFDRFMRFISAAREAATNMRASADAAMRDPTQFDPVILAVVKSRMLALDDRIALLNDILDLPKALKEQGERAGEIAKKWTADGG